MMSPRHADELRDLAPLVLAGQLPAIVGKGDRFTDASTGVIWEVAWEVSADRGPVWVLADVPQPDQEVTAMQPITETWWSVDNLALRDDGTVSVAVHDAPAVPTDSGYVPGFSFIVPLEMAPRIGEVITMSWGDPL